MNTLLLLQVLLFNPGTPTDAATLKFGDIVFHESQSRQSGAIKAATGSDITHVGIVFFKDGTPYVFEAVNPKTGRVGLTSYARWKARGVLNKIWVKRLKERDSKLTTAVETRMSEVGKSFTGRKYDRRFQWGKNRIYCSELVYDIYLVGAGISLGAVQQIRDLNLKPKVVKKLIRDRMKNKLDGSELIITPISLFNDERLKTIIEP